MSDDVKDAPYILAVSSTPRMDLSVNLAAIEAFVIAAEYTSIAEAARVSGVGESTFDKRIKALEVWTNVALFQRRPDLILTLDGYRFLPHAKRIVAEARLFKSDESVEQFRNELSGEIRKPKSGSLRRRHPSGKPSFIEVD